MRFADRIITLKDGRQCTLCPTTPDRAADMIEYLKITAAQTPFLLRFPDEVDFTVDGEEKILREKLEDEHSVMMMAIVDGKIAGNCSINPIGMKRKIRHRCSMGIAQKEEFCGLGIGTAMFNYLFELARQIGYEQMELGHMDTNNRAHALYTKMGFIETGRNARAFKLDENTYLDEIIMYKLL